MPVGGIPVVVVRGVNPDEFSDFVLAVAGAVVIQLRFKVNVVDPDLARRPNVHKNAVRCVLGDHFQVPENDVIRGNFACGAPCIVCSKLAVVNGVAAVLPDNRLVVANAGVALFLHVDIAGDDDGLRALAVQLLFQIVGVRHVNDFTKQAADGSRFFALRCHGVCGVAFEAVQVQFEFLVIALCVIVDGDRVTVDIEG